MEKTHIGGQAVIEGVMMRNDAKVAISVRMKNGEIKTRKESLKMKRKWLKLPLVRGVANMIEMLYVGIRALLWSADQQLGKHEKVTATDIAVTLFISSGFIVVFFFVVPFFMAKLFFRHGHVFNLMEGVGRIVIFLIYILSISLLSEVKVLFKYHGAEHKAVNCYSAGKPLTVENVKKFPTYHPRCGTSFILIVLIISVIFFSLIPDVSLPVKIGLRLLLIPVIAAVSYELLKLSERLMGNRVVEFVSLPGVWLQRITTKEPSDKQIEVAIKALKGVAK